MDLFADGDRLDALLTLAGGRAGRSARLSHQTAAELQDVELLTPSPDVHVTVDPSRTRVEVPGVVVHRSDVPPADRLELGPRRLRLTAGARTVVDLARTLPHDEAVVAADSALRVGAVAPAQLRAARDAVRGAGSGRVRAVLDAADERSGSVLESVARLLCLDADLGSVVPQLTVWPGGHCYDLGLPDRRTVVECQSLEFHRTREQLELDARWINEAYAAGWHYLQLTWNLVMVRPEAGRRALLGLR